jgi:hypothetical protein
MTSGFFLYVISSSRQDNARKSDSARRRWPFPAALRSECQDASDWVQPFTQLRLEILDHGLKRLAADMDGTGEGMID